MILALIKNELEGKKLNSSWWTKHAIYVILVLLNNKTWMYVRYVILLFLQEKCWKCTYYQSMKAITLSYAVFVLPAFHKKFWFSNKKMLKVLKTTEISSWQDKNWAHFKISKLFLIKSWSPRPTLVKKNWKDWTNFQHSKISKTL